MCVYTYMYVFHAYILHVYAVEDWPSRAIEVLETFMYYNQFRVNTEC